MDRDQDKNFHGSGSSVDMDDIRTSMMSIDRLDRTEAMWTEKNEHLLAQWMEDATRDARKHKRKGSMYKHVYFVLGMLTSALPVALSGLTDLIDDDIFTGLLIISGVMNACSSFINPSRKSESHFNAETRYDQLVITIQRDLTLKKRERPAVDLYLEHILSQMSRFKEISPPI